MAKRNISIYPRADDISSSLTVDFEDFIGGIQGGKWQDEILKYRTGKAKKKSLPMATISGKFKSRRDSELETHSGLISIDLDDVDPDEIKQRISEDPFVYCAFASVSGNGCCLIFKINPSKHREAFQGIGEYLFSTYRLVQDPTSINPSRGRFVSWDPALYINENTKKFDLYPKEKPPKKIENVVYSQSDFGHSIRQVLEERVNICESYHDWLRVAFGLVEKFGEEGRNYFHLISQQSTKYDASTCDRQYNSCLKAKGTRTASISTVYYYLKNAGIEIYSKETKIIARAAWQGKKSGIDAQDVIKNLKQFEDIEANPDLVDQVYKGNIKIAEDTEIDEIETWIKHRYSLRRNEITKYIEDNGNPLKQEDFNTIFISIKKVYEKTRYEIIDRLINSSFVPTYNPLKEFFVKYKDRNPSGCIEKVLGSIETEDSEYLKYFGKKWFVGIISAIYAEHSPLMLVLSGKKQSTGKTEWFRRLLPPELKKYYADSKLDAGKDDEILMTQKLIIMDDEMGGKSKKESKRLKELTSKEVFSLREPYGRNNVDLRRLAVLCGTSNDDELLNDPTGNRRIIPSRVFSIDHNAYNRVDKIDLFMEAYHLFHSGFDWKLSQKDIEYLGQDAISFEVTELEKELIQKYFIPGDKAMTASEIKIYLELKTGQKLILDRIGKHLKSLGFTQKKTDRGTKRVYMVDEFSDAPF